MALAAAGPNLFAGTGDWITCIPGTVFLSTDGGASWKAANSGLPKRTTVRWLAACGTDLFAGISEAQEYPRYGLFRSWDNGANWAAVDTSPMSNKIQFLTANGTNLWAVLQDGSVYLSGNRGTSWTAVSSGFPEVLGIVCFEASGTHLFAGTDFRGVWRLLLSDLPQKK